jgi:hypothetical protein
MTYKKNYTILRLVACSGRDNSIAIRFCMLLNTTVNPNSEAVLHQQVTIDEDV